MRERKRDPRWIVTAACLGLTIGVSGYAWVEPRLPTRAYPESAPIEGQNILYVTHDLAPGATVGPNDLESRHVLAWSPDALRPSDTGPWILAAPAPAGSELRRGILRP